MSVSWSIHRHLSNLQTESAAFFALVLQGLVMVFLLWEEGSVWQDLRVAECRFGVTLKAFRGVESAVTVVESPVLVGKLTSGSLVFISSGRIPSGNTVFVFSCCLKVRYLFCN